MPVRKGGDGSSGAEGVGAFKWVDLGTLALRGWARRRPPGLVTTQLVPMKMVQVSPLTSWPHMAASPLEWSQQFPSFTRVYDEACPPILEPS